MKVTIFKDGISYRENVPLSTLIKELENEIAKKSSVYDVAFYENKLKYTVFDEKDSSLNDFSVELSNGTYNDQALRSFEDEIRRLVKMYESVEEETVTNIEIQNGIYTHIYEKIAAFKSTKGIPLLSQDAAQKVAKHILDNKTRIIKDLYDRNDIGNLGSTFFGFLGGLSLISTIIFTIIAAVTCGPLCLIALMPGIAITKPLLMISASIRKEEIEKLTSEFFDNFIKKYNLRIVDGSIKLLTESEIKIQNQVKPMLMRYKLTKSVDDSYDIEAVKYLLSILQKDRKQIDSKLKKAFKPKLVKIMCGSSILATIAALISSFVLNPIFAPFIFALIFGSSIIYEKCKLSKLNGLITSFSEELMSIYGLNHDEESRKLETLDKGKEKEHISDKFLEYIKSDLDYISRHKDNGEFGDLIEDLSLLSIEYGNALNTEMLGGDPIDRYSYLKRLTAIEVEMYSRNTTVGLTNKNKVVLTEEIFQERLQYMGITATHSLNDKWLNSINDTVKKVLANPYEGCEEEISKLLSIAQEYVQAEISDKNREELNNQATLMKKLVAVEMTIEAKLTRAQKSTRLKEDLVIIQNAIAESSLKEEVAEYHTASSQGSIKK